MKRRILCLSLVFVSLISIVFSSFSVYADDFDINDYIEVHKPEIPKVDNNGDLLQDDIDTSFDNEFYNSPDEIDDSEKDFETFDKKQDYSSDDSTSSSASDSDVGNDNQRRSTKKSLYKSPRASTSSVNEDNENGIATLSDDAPNPFSSEAWKGVRSGTSFVVTPENVLACFINGFNAVADLPQYKFSFDGNGLISLYPDVFNLDNLIIYRYIDPYRVYNSDYHEYYYGFIFTDSDLHFTSVNPGVSKFDATYCNFSSSPNLSQGNIFSSVITCFDYSLWYDSFNFKFPNIDYKYNYGNCFYCGDNANFSIVYNGGNHKLFIDDNEISVTDPDNPYSNTYIIGEITAESVELSWKAYPKNEITDNTEYDVRLFAVDMETAPSKLTDDIKYLELSNYSTGGIINKENQLISDTANLENIYYYIHQMKAYDDSEESVTGYDFDEFEIRNTCTFVVAYKLKDSEDNYTVCADLVYDYEYIIDNVMGDFSVRKDYKDFPDIKDYIENFPDTEDFLPEGEDPGPIDWILAYFKCVIACIKTFGNNFIGFFRWLKDCFAVAFDNLAIALYNMVCDLKTLFLYLFKPKTKSIKSMVEKKIPGFSKLVNVIKSKGKESLPYLKLFGVKFGFFPELIDSNTKSFMRSMSSFILYMIFGFCVVRLLGKLFGFAIGSGGDDDSGDGYDYIGHL